MRIPQNIVRFMSVSMLLASMACGSGSPMSPAPVPPSDVTTANVYILPGAVNLGPNAFGDHPVTIYKGERMRLRNFDSVEHNLVPDSMTLEFVTSGLLAPGDERSFVMTTLGTTAFHCTIHPQMVGTLIVRER
jgi:plastocyanin